MDVAQQYRHASNDDDVSRMLALLAPDAEIVYPRRTLRGLDEIREAWSKQGDGPENLDVEVELESLVDAGDGRVVTQNRQIYRWKETGDLAYERRWHVEYVVRGAKIQRLAYTIIDGDA